MEKLKDQYTAMLKRVDEFKANAIANVVNNIKTIATKPVHIGNHWFYVVNHNGEEVPGYCHQNDYDPNNPKFLPIYGILGWSDFEECCRIFDLINGRLLGIEEPLWKRRRT